MPSYFIHKKIQFSFYDISIKDISIIRLIIDIFLYYKFTLDINAILSNTLINTFVLDILSARFDK